MKTIIFFIISYFLLAWSLFSMNNTNESDWRAPLIPLAQTYISYLPAQYTCVCTKFAHKWLNTQTRKDELRKIVSLEHLIDKLEDSELTAPEIYKFIINEIGPFEDEFGKNFFKACEAIMPPSCHRLQAGQCTVCIDELSTHILKACGHAPCCEKCLAQLNPKKCPLCRKVYSTTLPIEDLRTVKTCATCAQNEPNILFLDCHHMLFCEQCPHDFCPICNKKSEAIMKVFLHDNSEH